MKTRNHNGLRKTKNKIIFFVVQWYSIHCNAEQPIRQDNPLQITNIDVVSQIVYDNTVHLRAQTKLQKRPAVVWPLARARRLIYKVCHPSLEFSRLALYHISCHSNRASSLHTCAPFGLTDCASRKIKSVTDCF